MVSKIIIEKYGRRMIKGNNPNWKPSMTEPTKEEMLERLDEVIQWFPRYQSPALQERRDEIDDAIRSLVENMDKKPRVSREFVEKWQQEIIACLNLGLSDYTWKDLLPTMLAELGHEVEGRKEGEGEEEI